jgi:hypothetical protein
MVKSHEKERFWQSNPHYFVKHEELGVAMGNWGFSLNGNIVSPMATTVS